ncbi:gastric triacylglycerol lipase [Halyomorpha halys]|uniref:gastric triacylglycerol lipase n=1 Tax=Halyomorpha halys TaxID=286706 RepID=UPI0006D4FAA8|nr:gastric triacylglycerol lipase-like [Halyomorpha halys]
MMCSVRFLIFVLFCYFRHADAADDLAVSKLVLGQGYPFEEHEVVTEDGYILSVHRIPYGKNNMGKIGRPVIIQHGVLASSACWVLSRTDQALGFIMADHGYDVWMPNNRGNTYSLKHTTLNPNDSSDKKKFWDFSFHEMGYYDQPAIIDFILAKTNHTKLFYIGHSQGTTQFFALMSMRPEYNEKIIHMSALAPIAFLDHTRGTLKALTFFSNWLSKIANFLHIYHLLPSSPLIRGVEKLFCKTLPLTNVICENILFLIAGYDSQEVNMTLIPIITTYTPAGVSTKQLIHFGQLANNGQKFTHFNYGWYDNLVHYKQPYPPEYDVTKVTAPVALHYSHNDWISGIKDVLKLKSKLPNVQDILVPFFYFNHLDFMWAKDAWTLLYKPMLEVIQRY